ncbi:unnamed protein product [Ceratitis capitata]|uniref:(Mediterranean fruit fly) hypothetical protein n=1 Tax=Ceratitis capitata TaxID=7213 RepID=A0A811UZ94_CERCA|nr:unnamed protein product [Ceratitis capitata]
MCLLLDIMLLFICTYELQYTNKYTDGRLYKGFACHSISLTVLLVLLQLLEASLQQLFYLANCVATNTGFDMTMLPLTLPLLPLTVVIKYFSLAWQGFRLGNFFIFVFL